MATVNPYLNFNGNTEDVFNFYKSVFGGDFAMLMRMKDVPSEAPANAAHENLIMHVALPIGNGTMLMGSDIPDSYPPAIFGTNFNISISTDSKEEADKLFNGLSAGGKVFLAMGNTFWGSYFGMLEDKYQVRWMVGFDQKRN